MNGALNSVEKIYSEHARGIVENPATEMKERALACVAAIKREKPLTCPDDATIIATLEGYMLDYRAEYEAKLVSSTPAPPTSATDALLGAILDVGKLKTITRLD